jgi:hypothetical protein
MMGEIAAFLIGFGGGVFVMFMVFALSGDIK